MSEFTIRDYQQLCHAATLAARQRGFRSSLASVFTGGGKTETFIYLLKQTLDLKRERGLVMAPAHLVGQTYARMMNRVPVWGDKVKADGYDMVKAVGVEMADREDPNSRIVVGSIPTVTDRVPTDTEPLTLADLEVEKVGDNYRVRKSSRSNRRVLVSERMDRILANGLFHTIIWDEAHHAVSKGGNLLRNRIWEIDDLLKRPRTFLAGYTATATRKDGVALGNAFQCISFHRSVTWGIENNYLVPYQKPIRVHAQIGRDKDKVLKVDNWAEIIVNAWEEKAKDRLTLGYGPSVQEAEELALAFRNRGYKFAFVDANKVIDGNGTELRKEAQTDMLRQAYQGKLHGIINYGVFLEGTDLPPASCLLWARLVDDNPTITTQAIGRVLRLWEGDENIPKKTDALILDCTSTDLVLVGGGTLSGYRYDEVKKAYVEDEPNPEDELKVDIMPEDIDNLLLDVRDTVKDQYFADGVYYSIGRTVQKSGSQWSHHADDNIMTLGVSKSDIMVITLPYFTLSAALRYKADKMVNQPGMFDIAQATYKAADYFESYTLWHVKDEMPPQSSVFSVRDSLNGLMDFVTVYISEFETVDAFYKRNQKWMKAPISEPQARRLRELKIQPNPNWKQGEVSEMIAYEVAYKRAVLWKIGEMLLDCGPALDVALLKYSPNLLKAVATIYKQRKAQAG